MGWGASLVRSANKARIMTLSWRYFSRIQQNLAAVGWPVETEEELNALTHDLYMQRRELAELSALYGVAQKTIQNHLYAIGACRFLAEAQTKGWRYFKKHQAVLRQKGVVVLTPHDLDLWCQDQYENAYWSPTMIARYMHSTRYTVSRHLRLVHTRFRQPGGATDNIPPRVTPVPAEDLATSPYTPGERVILSTPQREFEATFTGWYTSPFGTCVRVKDPFGCFDVRNVAILKM